MLITQTPRKVACMQHSVTCLRVDPATSLHWTLEVYLELTASLKCAQVKEFAMKGCTEAVNSLKFRSAWTLHGLNSTVIIWHPTCSAVLLFTSWVC